MIQETANKEINRRSWKREISFGSGQLYPIFRQKNDADNEFIFYVFILNLHRFIKNNLVDY